MSEQTFAEFHETLTVAVPNISDQLIEFSEARKSNKGLVIELAAIHAGLTENYNHYGAKELQGSLSSWVSPYPKPIILNHDIKVDPVGRVMAAKMDREKDGTEFVRLQVAVTDPTAVEKIADQRYLTGSVGGRSEAALCSVCSADWAQASMFGPKPCKHVRGRTYKGQLAYLERINLEFKEYSFVNAPADSRSQILAPEEDGILEANEAEGWVTSAKFFGINMDKEEVLEYTESASRNVLANLRKKESSPLYLSLKGAFLSSLAEAAMYDDKETSAVSETVEVQEDDVLAVTEQLSDDLASPEADEDVEENEETSEDEVTEEDLEEDTEDANESTDDGVSDETIDESEETNEDGSSDEVEEASEETDEEVAEGQPQGQENEHSADIDSQFNTPTKDFPRPKAGGDKTRESDESEENVEETDVDATEEELEDSTSEADEQPTEEATKTREEELLEENARLKKALHRMLAERVVEMKITKGLIAAEERAEVLEDHLGRSASSLADSIRDLNSLPVQARGPQTEVPEMEEDQAVITDDGSTSTEESEEVVETVRDPRDIFEDVLVETLLGRRKL